MKKQPSLPPSQLKTDLPPPMLLITSCTQCPHFKRERTATADSWEEAYNWFCTKAKYKKIRGYVEWHEEDEVKVPDWCPLRGCHAK